MNIKYFIIFVLLFPGFRAIAQKPGLSKSGLFHDTLFCNNKVVAIMKTQFNPVDKSDYIFLSGKTVEAPLIVINRIGISDKKTENYLFSFPGLKLKCNVFIAQGAADIYSIICKNELIRNFNLDTIKVETFVILKGSKPAERAPHLSDSANEKGFVLKRDKLKPIVISPPENFEQDGQFLGTYNLTFVDGPRGKTRVYEIFNSLGALICTATETKDQSHDWRLLMYKNNRFGEVKSSGSADLESVIRFLIDKGYL